ncbi:ABC transporter permease [Nocardioides pocheonensis]|uniref:ABC transporter permease n=1 Tax=Nocardioides pocheonensis TaxID=661485 RepID=A0A3N0GUI1_9ACTN|nr:ABC transporter permease [Nocardioides pocheonensis]RNM15792.1 ABC transporter permease [Nocardioides pocheonensis]
MNGLRQARLVAAREIRERLRSPVYYVSLGLMLVSVLAAILAPSLVGSGGEKKVGVAGETPASLVRTLEGQARATGTEVSVRRYASTDAGEDAVRHGRIDVLVVDGRRLEWQRRADEELKALITGSAQVVAVQERATAAGIRPETLGALLAPVKVGNRVLGPVAGRTSDDETATYLLSIMLFLTVSVYGGMVLTGVVEEKSSRVVEVLLARLPPWSLLAGKIAGIGVLGLVQVAVTGVAALVAVSVSDLADLPAARASVLAWAVVWFVVGYTLIATAYGVLGSLTSRSEDASSVTGPLTVVLIAAYFAGFATIGSPDALWARLVSWFPVTAPFAMPNRIAMGAALWWEPLLALVLTAAATAGLVVLGGRIYSHAILRTGAVVKLVDAWRGSSVAARVRTRPGRGAQAALVAGAVALGAVAGVLSRDVVVGVGAGAIALTIASRFRKAHR